MNRNRNSVLRSLLPESLRRWLWRTFGHRWMRGDYRNWTDAAAGARPSRRSPDRLAMVVRAVESGDAAWERDGELFERPEVHEPLLRVLQQVARENAGVLGVVDFGGGLGSTWRQHRKALSQFEVRWRVVELPEIAAVGRNEFSNDVLTFHESLADACAGARATLLLCSSVLQYVPQPDEVLAEAVALGFPHIVLDRVSVSPTGKTRLALQHTPAHLGGGRMPCWLFAPDALAQPLRAAYQLGAEWTVPFDKIDGSAQFVGMHFRRTPASS